jgi:hypothetical protein
MKISKSQLDDKLKSSLPSKFSRFIYTVHALEHLCEETFNQLYGNKQGFNFSVDDNGSVIPLNSSTGYIHGAEFNQHFSTQTIHKPTPIKYKFYVDDGSIVDLKTRSVRMLFIDELIKKIKGHSNLMRYGLKNGFVRQTTGSNGKNPTLEVQIKYDKSVLNKKTGKREKKDISIILKLSLKPKGSGAVDKQELPFKKFLPGDVRRLLGNKLSSKRFRQLLLDFIDKQNISLASKQTFIKAIEHAYSNTNLLVPSIGSVEFSSELFEVLSALKLARIIETKEQSFLSSRLGWTTEQTKSVNPNDVRIYMPTAANEPLTDYEIFYNKNNSIKVSVKSRIKGHPATIKFHTAFSNEREVGDWFKGLATKNKSAKGSTVVASSAMIFRKKYYKSRESFFPIKALYDLLKTGEFSGTAWADANSRANVDFGSLSKQEFMTILKKTNNIIPRIRVNYDSIDNFSNAYSADELLKLKIFIAKNIKYKEAAQTRRYVDAAKQNMTKEQWVNMYPSEKTRYPFSVNNMAYLCEKIVVATSKKDGSSQINFWQLFYDTVLSKKQILYSVMYEKKTGNDDLTLEYKFISMLNFRQYSDWVDLRSKNSAFNMQDTLGMNV